MLGSPVATSEGGINVVTNVRVNVNTEKQNGKTGGIDVMHFRRFLRGLGFKLGGNRVL